MALFHFHVTQVRRSAGQSTVAAAAYRAGERLFSEYYGEVSDFTRKHIQVVTDYILRYEDYFRARMEERLRLETGEQVRVHKKKLERGEKRIAELKRLFVKIYEDNASERLSDERFDLLSQSYEAEQKALEAEAATLQHEISVQEQQNESIEKFIQKAHKYMGLDGLDGYALHELASAIYVDAPDKSTGKRRQHIQIKYDGLGFIPLDELMKKGETA